MLSETTSFNRIWKIQASSSFRTQEWHLFLYAQPSTFFSLISAFWILMRCFWVGDQQYIYHIICFSQRNTYLIRVWTENRFLVGRNSYTISNTTNHPPKYSGIQKFTIACHITVCLPLRNGIATLPVRQESLWKSSPVLRYPKQLGRTY